MKKFFASLFFALILFSAFSSENETDVSIFNELSSAYNSGFYPGAVQYAEKLENDYPDSFYIATSFVLKGESLIHLRNFDEAYKTLLKAEKMDLPLDLKNSIYFWFGKIFKEQKKYDEAIAFYHEYCSLAGEKGNLFPFAIYDSALIYYKNGDFKNAALNFEYVAKNASKYELQDYYSAVLKLADSYNKTGNAKKTIKLYSKIDSKKVPSVVYYAFTEYAGDAWNELKEYKKAYDSYCAVLKSGEKELISVSLKKAYNVSSEHKKEVGTEPGSILLQVQKNFSENPALLAEFWVRLAIDSFLDGDFEKSSSYFFNAEKYVSIQNDKSLYSIIQLYKAEITAGKNITSSSAKKASEELFVAREKLFAEQQEDYKNDFEEEFNALFAKYEAYQGNWENVKKYKDLLSVNDSRSQFYLALANYKMGNYKETSQLLKDSDLELYALSLARENKLKEAAAVYKKIDDENKMSPSERLNYSKVLILSGRYTEAQIQAAKCGLNEGKYILGLAQFNTRSWPYAEESFSSYIKNADKKDSKQAKNISYARFYLGYSLYRMEKTKLAYENLSAFIKQYPTHELFWNACITCTNSLVQMENYSEATKIAEKAVLSATNEDDKATSILLYASVYSDLKDYEKAIQILKPYSMQKNALGMKSLFQIAQIYEKKGDIPLADQKYREVALKFPNEKTGEEGLYRSAEIFYENADYETALKRFSDYKNKYKDGIFIASSWYYTADCMEKTGNSSGAILQNQALIKKFPESTYVYNAAKNLVSLYRAEGKYQSALENANFLLKNYYDQAKSDGLQEEVSQLKKLTGGKNEALVKKEAEYKQLGSSSTPQGRKAGTELALLYAQNSETLAEAERLSKEIILIQEKNNKNQEESLYIAQNAENLALLYKGKEKNKESAQMFLKSAKFYRVCGKDDEAAKSLYSAYDSFLACALKADANETALSLKSLYPLSRYAKSVKTDN